MSLEVEAKKGLWREGIKYGLWAGLFFALMEVIGYAAMHAPAMNPFRAAASPLLGHWALAGAPFILAFAVGAIIHFALSAAFGAGYASLLGRLTPEMRGGVSREIAFGLFFGLGVYLLNFQIIARVMYPWFQQANQSWQLVAHTLFFGLPLGAAYAWGERRSPQLAHATRPARRSRRPDRR